MIKARVARELSDNEIYLCEVLMENVLDDLEPNEIAALLSVTSITYYNLRASFASSRVKVLKIFFKTLIKKFWMQCHI